LNDQSGRAEPKDPRIEAALGEYLEQIDRGEPLDREKFLARHPTIADELRSFIASEDEVRKLAGAEVPPDVARDSTKSFTGHGQDTLVPQAAGRRSPKSPAWARRRRQRPAAWQKRKRSASMTRPPAASLLQQS
jgi:hypothetical protein